MLTAEMEEVKVKIADVENERIGVKEKLVNVEKERIEVTEKLVNAEKENNFTQVDSMNNRLTVLHNRLTALDNHLTALHNYLAELQKKKNILLSLGLKPDERVLEHDPTAYYNKFKPYSASQIQSNTPFLYDPFLFPCSSNSYIPNRRLRELRDSIERDNFPSAELEDCDLNLQTKFMYLQSWATPDDESESMSLDPNVNSAVLDEIATVFNQSSNNHQVTKRIHAIPFDPVMCKSVNSEYRLDFVLPERASVLLTSECKGSDASQFVCLLQGLEIAADSAIYMSRSTTLHYEDCSIPGILVYADVVQFYGVYLVQDFPVIVYLTPPLSYSNVESRQMIVRSIFACAKYLHESVRLLHSTQFSDSRSLRPLQFDYKNYFYKPIKTGTKTNIMENGRFMSPSFVSLERIMYIYQKISIVEECSEYVLFPSGLLRFPDDNCEEFTSIRNRIREHFPWLGSLSLVPLILFPYFKDNVWNNSTPSPDQSREYIAMLTRAVDVLNTAKVAHMDLRPANIMWRVTAEKGIELQIIDFEDAVSFGCKIRHSEELRYDSLKRYPPMESDTLLYASSYHNYWFLVCITEWVCMNESDKVSFEDFMQKNRDSVVSKFVDFMLVNNAASALKV